MNLAPHFLIFNIFLVVPDCSKFVLNCSRIIVQKNKKQGGKSKKTVFWSGPPFFKKSNFFFVPNCSGCSKQCSKVLTPQKKNNKRYNKKKKHISAKSFYMFAIIVVIF